MQSQKTDYFIASLEGKGEDTSSSGHSMHRHHGGTCCAGCFPTHTPAPVCFMTHVVSHTWKYILTIHPKGAVCSFGASHAGGACCAVDNQRQCSHGLSGIRQMQLAKGGLDSAFPVRELNETFPFQNLCFWANPFTFLWHTNTIFLSTGLWRRPPFRVQILLSLDRTFIDTIRTVDWPGSIGLVTECRWYVWVSGHFFSRLEVRSDDEAEHRNPQTHRRWLPGYMGNENKEV